MKSFRHRKQSNGAARSAAFADSVNKVEMLLDELQVKFRCKGCQYRCIESGSCSEEAEGAGKEDDAGVDTFSAFNPWNNVVQWACMGRL